MRKFGFLLFLFAHVALFSQTVELFSNGKNKLLMEKHQVRFNLLSPGIQYEIGLFKNVTASTSFGLGLATPSERYSLAPALQCKS